MAQPLALPAQTFAGTQAQAWKIYNMAVGFFQSVPKTSLSPSIMFRDQQILYDPLQGHTHNGIDSRVLAPTAITKEAFDLNSVPILWGNYFSPHISTSGAKYLITMGQVTVTPSSGSDPNYGEATIDRNLTTGDADLGTDYTTDLGAASEWNLAVLVCNTSPAGGATLYEPVWQHLVATNVDKVRIYSSNTTAQTVNFLAVFVRS